MWRILGACTGVLECVELRENKGRGSISGRYEERDRGVLLRLGRSELTSTGGFAILLLPEASAVPLSAFLGLAVVALVQR